MRKSTKSFLGAMLAVALLTASCGGDEPSVTEPGGEQQTGDDTGDVADPDDPAGDDEPTDETGETDPADDEPTDNDGDATQGEPSDGGDPTEDEPSDNDQGTDPAGAATGDEVSGNGYSFRVPEGWQSADEWVADEPMVEVAYVEFSDADFANNLNLVREPNQGASLDDYEDVIPSVLTGLATADPQIDRVTVAGQEVIRSLAPAEQEGVGYFLEQYVALTDDSFLVLTFSFGLDTPDEQRGEVIDSVFATLSWS